MKRVWLQDDEELTGSMLATWSQSYGLSRDERTGRWLFSDRRDDRRYEGRDGSVNTEVTAFASTAELAEYLISEERIFSADELLEMISRTGRARHG